MLVHMHMYVLTPHAQHITSLVPGAQAARALLTCSTPACAYAFIDCSVQALNNS